MAAAIVAAPITRRTLESQTPAVGALTGVREPAWSPDGRRIAAIVRDRLWTMTPDGRRPERIARGDAGIQREPAWSRDGRRVAFASDRGTGFDLFVVGAKGGVPQRVTSIDGDERSPSWTPDGRLVFAHRNPGASWHLDIVVLDAGSSEPTRLTGTADNDTQPRVSPDGTRVLFVSDRDSDDGDVDLWLMPLPAASDRASRGGHDALPAVRARRVVAARGEEGWPSWAPQGDRIAYYAVRENVASTWVSTIDSSPQDDARAGDRGRPHPAAPPVLVSRRGGATAWSPDGRTILFAALRDPQPIYNGNPRRDDTEEPPLFGLGDAYRLWSVPAPLPIDGGMRGLTGSIKPEPAELVAAFDRVWTTLKRLYYAGGQPAVEWEALRSKYRPEAQRARDEAALERVLDGLVAEQPLIKPRIESPRAVVVSAHPLASEAGRLVIENGGNVVDAAIAVAFALGVVEPDASGIGGDGQAVLSLKGMRSPTVVEYKDQIPFRATADNTKIIRNGRIVADGPAAANIPGVVAGLDYLYTHYGSRKVSWADLIAPAIRYAEEGYELDGTLPSTIEAGRHHLRKYSEAAKLFLPGGRVPKRGDRFVNRDYAGTLRAIARDGADAFYRGTIAHQIAADMEASGGIIGLDDLAQYRAIERQPIVARYRGHVLFSGGPPVAAGINLFESLQILANYAAKPGARSVADPEYWHYQIESWKARDGARRIADPAFWPVEYESHLSAAHAERQFRHIDPVRAGAIQEEEQDPVTAAGDERIGRGTTAFVVVDADGSMIAVTQTLSTWGGTFYVSKGLGFLYNNHLRAARLAAGYGQMLPLMRSNTASVPTLVFAEANDRRVPRLAVGCAGNAWITASVYNIIASVIDGGMTMQRAIEAPRFLVARDPLDPKGTAAVVQIEDRFPRTVVDALAARGHRFQKIGRKGELRYGFAAGALLDLAGGRVEGGADPRRSHAVSAVP